MQNLRYSKLVKSDVENIINFYEAIATNITSNLSYSQDILTSIKRNIFLFYSSILTNTRFLLLQPNNKALLDRYESINLRFLICYKLDTFYL